MQGILISAIVIGGIVIGGIVLVFWLLRPRPQVRLEVRAGQVEVTRGKVPQRFARELAASFDTLAPPDGVIDGFRAADGRLRLTFPTEYPEGLCQRVRNLWNLYGAS